MSRRPFLIVAALACLGVVIPRGGVVRAEESPPGVEAGIWQKHQYRFQYMGFTSTYSCDGLADQLQRLLKLAGARADAKVSAGACSTSYGQPDKFANATLVFYSLAPAATTTTPGEPAPGQWIKVGLAARHPLGLETGDCELVEQFRDTVLKKMFTIRSLDDNTRCVPFQQSGSLISLHFDVFIAVPGAAPAAPAASANPPLFAYPARGQSAQQQASDRTECESSAGSPAGLSDAAAEARAGALRACLVSRGYTVR